MPEVQIYIIKTEIYQSRRDKEPKEVRLDVGIGESGAEVLSGFRLPVSKFENGGFPVYAEKAIVTVDRPNIIGLETYDLSIKRKSLQEQVS